MPDKDTLRALVLEKDAELSSGLESHLIGMGLVCITAADTRWAEGLIQKSAFDFVFVDEWVEHAGSGLDFIRFARTRIPDSKLILMAKGNEEDSIQKAKAIGADDCINFLSTDHDFLATVTDIVIAGSQPPVTDSEISDLLRINENEYIDFESMPIGIRRHLVKLAIMARQAGSLADTPTRVEEGILPGAEAGAFGKQE